MLKKTKLENLQVVKENLAAKYEHLSKIAGSKPKSAHFRNKAMMYKVKARKISEKIANL